MNVKTRLLLLLLLCTLCGMLSAQTWDAKFITLDTAPGSTNVWAIWRKTATLNAVPRSVQARIATDTKYWLWVNDSLVVFEGGLKRGPKPTATYYDVVELAPYLHRGDNTIAVQTWHFGKEGFSHKNSGQMGLLFQAKGKGVNICSDETWRGALYDAYGETGDPRPNYRIPESNLRFDAVKERVGWYRSDYTGSLGPVHCQPVEGCALGELEPRPIPQWKNSGLRSYVRTEQHDDTLYCYLPYNCQLTPYIRLHSRQAGQTVRIQTDVHKIGDANTIRCEYVTREGEQAYENYGWMNGHQVWYIVPEGVEVLEVKYRETGYGADYVEPFRSDDPFFGDLWVNAQRTLYITMRDNYMDCPDRERGQWWGDAVNELGETFYSLTVPGQQLAAKGLAEVFNWQKEDGVIFSPCPAGNWDRELPCQMLATAGYYGLYTQCFYSGDFSLAKCYMPNVHRYLYEVWQPDEQGLVPLRQGGWTWGDWGDNIDMLLLQNTWYYLAVKGEYLLAKELGMREVMEQAWALMQKIEANFDARFWSGKSYRSPDYTGADDDRANAMAVVAGLASEDKYEALTKVLTTEYHASPYMEKYVLEALFCMNADQAALDRIRQRYHSMLEIPGLTTLPELWIESGHMRPGEPLVNSMWGTYNHGWSGGPLTMLSQKVCGVEPTQPGFRSFRIRPQMGALREASCTVATVRGDIRVEIERKGDGMTVTAQVPRGTRAQVVFPSGETRSLRSGKHTVSGR